MISIAINEQEPGICRLAIGSQHVDLTWMDLVGVAARLMAASCVSSHAAGATLETYGRVQSDAMRTARVELGIEP